MRADHPVLHTPLKVPHNGGALTVLKGREKHQIGEAISLDSLENSCDAEILVKGDSAKGPNRASVSRHGPYTFCGYGGEVDDMTLAGRALFINTVHWAAQHGSAVVLEKRVNKTRDGLMPYLRKPGLIQTMRRYIPEDLAEAA